LGEALAAGSGTAAGSVTSGSVTVAAAVRAGAQRLAAAGCDTPRLDAELLLGEVLGVDRSRLVIDARRELSLGETSAFWTLIGRREEREPVAYILGRREFRRLSLQVDRRVLIPRPETELLVDVGLELGRGLSVADVGTGSGAVALALKDERLDLTVSAFDNDPGALEVARANAARLGLEVSFALADLLDEGRYDAVLANLPYVEAGLELELEPEVSVWEPAGALFAGPDGLSVVRRLVGLVSEPGHLPSLLALEIGPSQAAEVSELVRSAGFGSVEVLPDLAGHDRVVVGRA
jgi:release factor glutamine methyltransferase